MIYLLRNAYYIHWIDTETLCNVYAHRILNLLVKYDHVSCENNQSIDLILSCIREFPVCMRVYASITSITILLYTIEFESNLPLILTLWMVLMPILRWARTQCTMHPIYSHVFVDEYNGLFCTQGISIISTIS